MKKIFNFCLFIFIYELAHNLLNINEIILPSISSILISFYKNIYIISLNTLISLIITIIGLFLAIIFSILVSILINENKCLKKPFLKVIYILQMIPIIAIGPLIIIWFGLGIFPKILLIIIYCSFPIIINLVGSFNNISKEHKYYILSLSKKKIDLYKYLYFPLSYDSFFSGTKIAITYSMICTITGEYLGTKYGVGLLLKRAYSSYQTDLVFAIIIVIVLITMILLKINNSIEKKVRN